MVKKIIFLVVVLGLIGGGVFYWWQGQAEVRELNKTLPEGIRVEKSLFGGYKAVNNIDGYEFKIPPEWRGVNEIVYVPERTEEKYILSGIELEGKEGAARMVVINRFKIEESNVDLKSWAEENFETFGLVGEFSEDNIADVGVIKIQEDVHLMGMYVYFFQKDLAIYAMVNDSEEFIRYIIANGKW